MWHEINGNGDHNIDYYTMMNCGSGIDNKHQKSGDAETTHRNEEIEDNVEKSQNDD